LRYIQSNKHKVGLKLDNYFYKIKKLSLRDLVTSWSRSRRRYVYLLRLIIYKIVNYFWLVNLKVTSCPFPYVGEEYTSLKTKLLQISHFTPQLSHSILLRLFHKTTVMGFVQPLN